MQRRFRRTCPVCGRPDLKNISTHLSQVHGLSSEERKPYLKQAQVSSWQPRVERSPHMTMSYINVEKPGQKRVKQSEHSPPAKRPRTATRTTSLAAKSCPDSTSAINSHFWLWALHKAGKHILSNKFWKTIVSCMKSKRVLAFFGTTINGKNVYEKLKKSLGKSIRFERGVPELSEDLCEINARYNNIIILDDLMAEATDSPVVSRLFTQGRHRNASVILLLQNMFPKGKYNTDISRNAQYLALFQSPSDRKQIGIIADRMFDKNRVHFMNAYYKETEKPYGYLLVDNKPGTPPDNQILADLFGECYAYHFGVNSTEPTRVETKPVGKHSTATKITSSRKKPVQTVTWSDVPNDVWQKYTLGAPAVRKIPEGYVIIEMYTTSRNKIHQPVRGGVLINDENYWPVKLKHRGSGHIK